ncbi:MAG: hypothetical protein RLZZ28_2103 [Bacteroidota bacterium]|jgi:hypothetical protein
MAKKWKILLVLLTIVISLFIVTAIFISPITKYLVEKYSVKYTGRQILMDGLTINLLNGNVHITGLKIYEAKKKELFFTCKDAVVNITVYRLWAGNYEITQLKASSPVLYVKQDGQHFNYDDLMTRFFSDTSRPDPNAKPVQYWVKNLSMQNGIIVYENKKPYAKIEIINANGNIPLIAWNDSLYHINADCSIKTGGRIKAAMIFNVNTYQYRLSLDVNQFNISWMYPYLKEYMMVKSLDGLVSSNMHISGNFNKPTAIAASGNLSAEKFSIVDNTDELLAAVDKLTVKIDTLNSVKNSYNFSTISLEHPFARLSMYDKGFNYERIMTTPFDAGSDSATVVYSNIFLMMAGYIQDIVKQYDVNNYKIQQLKITRGQCIFTDFTHGDKFRYVLDSLWMSSDKINSNNPQLVFDVKARLNSSGKMKGVLKVDPKNYKDIEIDARITDLLMKDFNPYTKYYVATPFLAGKINYANKTVILAGNLDSKNVLDIYQLTAGKKIKDVSTAINLPVRLAVSLLKDVKGNIHIDIPVKGTVDDPKFKWGKVVWGVVKNLIVKAATAPFRLIANLFGGKEEDFKEIPFEYLQPTIGADQQKILDQLAKMLVQKPELKLELTQVTNKEDEGEQIALLEMKKLYLGIPSATVFDEGVKKRTDSVKAIDQGFVSFLNGKLNTVSNLESPERKCVRIVGSEKINAKIKEVMGLRDKAVLDYLRNAKQVPAERVAVINAKITEEIQKSETPKFNVNVAVRE